MEIFTKKKLIIIAAAVLLLMIVMIIAFISVQRTQNIPQPGTESVPQVDTTALKELQTISIAPTLHPARGKGIDIDSKEIRDSTASINSLAARLPYQKVFTTSQGIEIEVLIPPSELLENEWTLTTHIFGIDYMVPVSSKEYDIMKISFLEGAQDVYNFLTERGIDTKKIIIRWGDRSFIQEQSKQWLTE